MLIVQKYGGSSVANAERVFNVAKRIMRTRMEGNDVVVVLSAQGKTTDGLIAKAKEINAKPSRREMDMLLSTGEQQSVALMAMAISAIGGRAVSLNAAQVGIETTNTYSNARIRHINTERIENELDEGSIVLVTGFQGVNAIGDTTTLGRGGSDTSAVALAAALNADMCEIYTDVEGVYTADPRVVPDAVKLDEISYDEMLELASLGAKVLHSRSVEVAKKYNMDMEFEFDYRVMASNPEHDLYYPRMLAYMKAFKDHKIWETKRLAYYEGGGNLLSLKNSSNEADNS